MTSDLFEETKRLTEIISSIDYVDRFDNFKIIGMEGKEVVGFMAGNTDGTTVDKHYVYQTIYKSIKHVDFYIKKSLYDALDMIYIQDYKDFGPFQTDRKSTRLNSSHVSISYAVFCLKKKKKKINNTD